MATRKTGNWGPGSVTAVLALSITGTAASLLAYRRALEALVRTNAEILRRLDALDDQRRQASRRADRIEYQRDHRQLLLAAMKDHDLLPVLDAYEGDVPPRVQKQYLFANALYVHALHGYRIGLLTRAELRGYVRVLFQSPTARAYWEATRHHRASLRDGSEEAEIGKMTDDLLTELDEADTDEWWVVGDRPAEE
ncbi:DUF6082 family protein [Streptomyces shenzhenensis]|uniref:DUF6082 family protein n=1 Tax=Streptomyces shenzhenensis TaxID=943815 RepID=UPI001C7F7389|nr:DUF6082 family protein [Streptomyces shenzhenensis]